ncbi:MAG: complex I NDUFA9 subunit family protein [Enhydrobacter sp.]|nr:MAG: complex I NDUFA9 subunit family protein [Enhydrobacter sp.]
MDIRQVTVFGGSGFIGRAIVRALARQGFVVRAAARRIEYAEVLKTAGDVGQVTLVRANLRMPESVANALRGSQAVVNAAGIPYQRGRQTYDAVHAQGARVVAEAARSAGVQRLVQISGLGADNRSSRNAFIRSKVAAEDAVVSAFDDVTILRNSVVFGANDAMFNRLAGIAWAAPFVPLAGNGKAKVQPVFVGDVARATVAVLARRDSAKSVFELGGPRVYTYREIAELVLRVINRRKPIVAVPTGLMKFGAFFAQQIALVGLTPPITVDQVELMLSDNVVRPGARSLADLDIEPTAAEVILPTYLDRFRVGGRYNQHAPA